MKTSKKTNLLQLSSLLLAESEMQNVHGGEMENVYEGGVACSPSNCNDVHTSANNCLDNMRKNNPPT